MVITRVTARGCRPNHLQMRAVRHRAHSAALSNESVTVILLKNGRKWIDRQIAIE
jgi:hypothetical protein